MEFYYLLTLLIKFYKITKSKQIIFVNKMKKKDQKKIKIVRKMLITLMLLL